MGGLQGMRPGGGPRTCWGDYISHLVWDCLRISQKELHSVGWAEGCLDYLTRPTSTAARPSSIGRRKWRDAYGPHVMCYHVAGLHYS